MQNMKVKSLVKSGGERTKAVSFRLTLTEYNLLASNARKQNMKLSDYARKVLVDNMDIREGKFIKGDVLTAYTDAVLGELALDARGTTGGGISSTDAHYVVVGGENLTVDDIEKKLSEMWK